MGLFRHTHRFETVESFMKSSLITGAPVSVARIKRCKCGEERRELTEAGWQQVGWGAEQDSLFGDGPIERDPLATAALQRLGHI